MTRAATIHSRFLISAVACLGLSAASCAFAGTCQNNLAPTNPDAIYSISEGGVVTDKRTRLMWTRCSVGQPFDGVSCIGLPDQFDWAQALAAAEQSQHADHTDWRLPNVKELASLAEFCGTSPAISPMAFPDAPATRYWSSSIAAAGSAEVPVSWCVDFGNGSPCVAGRSEFLSIRLVREGSP